MSDERDLATVQGRIDGARQEIRAALSAYGPTLDDMTRELLSAVDALDRARKRLRERMAKEAARAMPDVEIFLTRKRIAAKMRGALDRTPAPPPVRAERPEDARRQTSCPDLNEPDVVELMESERSKGWTP